MRRARLTCKRIALTGTVNRPPNMPRKPIGPSLAASTTRAASALVETWGPTMPLAPRLSVRVIGNRAVRPHLDRIELWF